MGFGVDSAKFGSKKRFENGWLSGSDFRKQSRRTTVFGAKKGRFPRNVLFVYSFFEGVDSEGHPHLIPLCAPMLGGGDAFVDESELGVVVELMLLTGQHQSFPSLPFAVVNG